MKNTQAKLTWTADHTPDNGAPASTWDANDAAGTCVGWIEKEVSEVGTGMAREYRVDAYTVSFADPDRSDEDRTFEVAAHAHARAALAAAKKWLRESV